MAYIGILDLQKLYINRDIFTKINALILKISEMQKNIQMNRFPLKKILFDKYLWLTGLKIGKNYTFLEIVIHKYLRIVECL